MRDEWKRFLEGRSRLLLALGLGFLSALFAFVGLRGEERRIREGWELVEVLAAKEDVGEGALLEGGAVERRGVPEQFVTSSVVRPEHLRLVAGQRLVQPLKAGEPLRWTHFETAERIDRLARVVQRKGRAVTVAAADRHAVGGWIRPHDHVDVLSTFRDPSSQELVTTTLLQNVIVLATGADDGKGTPERRYSDVTLLVLPEEAEQLVLAQELGSLTLTLRHPEDGEAGGERSRATAATLLTGERRDSLQKLRQATIQVIRGRGAR